jgi:peptide deformylase
MELVKYPDPILKMRALEVVHFGERLRQTAEKMLELMYGCKGLGLAGPQAGISRSLVVINPSGKQEDELVLANPQLVETSGEVNFEEGCLSFPGIYARIVRPESITCVARTLDGTDISFSCEGLVARIVQHEIDHLAGVLLVDRMNPAERKVHQRALRRLRKEYKG